MVVLAAVEVDPGQGVADIRVDRLVTQGIVFETQRRLPIAARKSLLDLGGDELRRPEAVAASLR